MAAENAAKIVIALADIGNFVDAILADGKINWSDTVHVPKLATFIPAVIGAVTHFGTLRDELIALDEDGRKALVDGFKEQFDIEEDDVEKVVEQAIEVVSHAGDVIKQIVEFSKKIKK